MSKTSDSKSSKYRGFREFYEDGEARPNTKKRLGESNKDKMRFRDKLKKIDPKAINEEDFDDDNY